MPHCTPPNIHIPSITEETKMARWMSSGSLLQDAHLTSLPQFIHLYVPGKVGCSREVRELGWGWSSLLRYTKEAMVFDLGRYQPTQSHFNSEVRATGCSPYTHRQFPGSSFALESRVYGDDDMFNYVSPSDQCSQNPCQLRITLDVILAYQTIYLSSNDVLSWVHRGTRME